MSSSTRPDPARERLARLMNERRRELGRRRRRNYTWDEVAAAAGLHRETLRSIRNGVSGMRDSSKDGIEAALQWAPGSIDRILANDDPRPLDPPPPDKGSPADGEEKEESPTDRLERLWQEYKDDPGEKGTVLRGLLQTWGAEREGHSEAG